MSVRGTGNTIDFDYLLKIVVIGDPGVGKTSLLLRYIDGTYSESYLCTIGVDFKVKTVVLQDQVVKMQIWDTAGQERFKPITKCYYRGSHGAVAVFDVSNRDSFTHVMTWIADYQEHNPLESQQMILLVANKTDLEDRKVTEEEGLALSRQLKCPYLEASAKANLGIDELFESMAKQAVTHMRPNSLSARPEISLFKGKSMPVMEAPRQQKKKSCC